MHQFDIYKQSITIEDITYNYESFRNSESLDIASKSDFHRQLFIFLKDWFSDSPTLKVKTSGSTDTPKVMEIEKERMMQSAQLTCSFLHLKKGERALLCMPLEYIAGKMMVVRSLIAGLNLHIVPPSGHPLANSDIPFDFAAMIPLQVYNSLETKIESDRIKNIKKLIIGGGAIDKELEERLSKFPNDVYSTYGMTETLSHIALRQINGSNRSSDYVPFDTVQLSLSDEGALIINAPLVNKETLYTNDIAEISDNRSFRILGRKDNIINSGGVKIQIEELESSLKPFIGKDFAITSLPDPKLGETVVLLTKEYIDLSKLSEQLPQFHVPKKIFLVNEIPHTETGKINRVEAKKLALKLNNK